MNKNVDGIRKLNKKELERSRKIVLEIIGEGDKRERKDKDKFNIPSGINKGRMLDGLSSSSKKAERKLDDKPSVVIKPSRWTEQEIEKKLQEKKRREIKEQREREKLARKRREKEKIRMKRKNQKRIKRREWAEARKKQFIRIKQAIKKGLKRIGKIFILAIVFLGLLLILCYFIFALLLLKFNLDSKITRQITQYIPVPAVVTKIGFINYYDYLKIIDNLNKEIRKGSLKTELVRKIILNKLAKKYNVNKEKDIDIKLIADEKINEISYSRIKKIRQLIGSGENFGEIGEKYSDEHGYINEDNEYLYLREEVQKLEVGQISDIIIMERGYYIIKKEDKKLNFIFIKAMTLDEYLDDMNNKLRVWILVN